MRRIGTKLVCLALAFCLLFCLASCGQGSEPEQAAQDHVSNEAAPSADNKAEQEDDSAGEGRSLVVYFSRTVKRFFAQPLRKSSAVKRQTKTAVMK